MCGFVSFGQKFITFVQEIPGMFIFLTETLVKLTDLLRWIADHYHVAGMRSNQEKTYFQLGAEI